MGARKVFMDTGAFHALLVKNDACHANVIAELRRLQADRCRFITTDYIMDETVTLLKARQVSQLVPKLFEMIEHSSHLTLEWVGAERFWAARDYLLKHQDHRYSFTDCTSFVVMQELQITEALSADRHFMEAGFRPLLQTN